MACMDKSPKKIVRSELLCFLSGCTLTKELKECGFLAKVLSTSKVSSKYGALLGSKLRIQTLFSLIFEMSLFAENYFVIQGHFQNRAKLRSTSGRARDVNEPLVTARSANEKLT